MTFSKAWNIIFSPPQPVPPSPELFYCSKSTVWYFKYKNITDVFEKHIIVLNLRLRCVQFRKRWKHLQHVYMSKPNMFSLILSTHHSKRIKYHKISLALSHVNESFLIITTSFYSDVYFFAFWQHWSPKTLLELVNEVTINFI